jgi:hypothetical protein
MKKSGTRLLRCGAAIFLLAAFIALPARAEGESLSAEEFSRMVRDFSEEGGYFFSDNFPI